MTTATDYTTVTEVPGNLVTTQAIDMLWTRYEFAASLCEDRDVVEVACGPGAGLTHLADRARRVIGGDYTEQLLRVAKRQTGNRVPLLRLDAQHLPFASGSFDAVLLFEAIYYLADARRFVREAHRVLRPSGMLLVVSVNPSLPDFNPSPFSHRYYDSEELRTLLAAEGFEPTIKAAFPAAVRTRRDRIVSATKRTAVHLRLVPTTMKGKERLKRLFYGKLIPFPETVHGGLGTYDTPVAVPAGTPAPNYKLLFAIGSRR